MLTPSSHGYLMAYSGLIAFFTQSAFLPLLHSRYPTLYVHLYQCHFQSLFIGRSLVTMTCRDERGAMIVAAGMLSVMSLMQFFARPGADVYVLFVLPITLIATSFLNIHLGTKSALEKKCDFSL